MQRIGLSQYRESNNECIEINSNIGKHIAVTIDLTTLTPKWNAVTMPNGYHANDTIILGMIISKSNGIVWSGRSEAVGDPSLQNPPLINIDAHLEHIVSNNQEIFSIWINPDEVYSEGDRLIVHLIKYS